MIRATAASLLLAGSMAVAAPALAEDDWIPPVTDALTQTECGDCHMAFQPGFLPARSWDAMMDGLADHFGDDATLSPADTAHIRAYLTANAGDVRGSELARDYMRWVRPDGVPLRITENPAFLREHDFRPEVWDRPEVVTPSNCLACHRDAERGSYEDD
ncbi:diheme cytochrome c [Roseospira goensis]|uniref:Mono/diheme cytochrome c family protein n=1 Tax=Roseospira goensis TaxID=391922 RepID=A0A7W6WJX2_9PROT|nr:diheme cytochrome c [Roseospira goensis]MBB4285104.1 mono/diheme cytochrome c family protein [Roseospira goensis]